MTNKKIGIVLVMMLMLGIMLAGTASAAANYKAIPTIVRPVSTTIVHSNAGAGAVLNFTCTGSNTTLLYNVTWWARSAGATANTSWIMINRSLSRNLTNCTAAQMNNTYLNFRYNYTKYPLEDGADYQFKVELADGGGGTQNKSNSTATTGVEIDKTVPTAPTAIAPASGSKWNLSDDVNINATVTGSQTTSCRLDWVGSTPTGNPTETMTNAGNICSVNITGMPEGAYSYKLRAYDGTNWTAYTSIYNLLVDVDTASPLAKAMTLDSAGQPILGGDSENNTARNIALIGILGVLIYIAVNRNKN